MGFNTNAIEEPWDNVQWTVLKITFFKESNILKKLLYSEEPFVQLKVSSQGY